MNLKFFLSRLRSAALGAAAAACALGFAGSASAQTVVVDGKPCTFSSYTSSYSSASGTTFNFTTSCSATGGSPAATLSVGNVAAGAYLATDGSNSVDIAVSCSGTCTGISVLTTTTVANLAVTNNVNASGSGTIHVAGTGALTGTNAIINVSGSSSTSGLNVFVTKAAVDVPIGSSVVVPAGCTTGADKNLIIGNDSRVNVSMSGAQTAAIKFQPVRGSRIPPTSSGRITVSTGTIGAAPGGWTFAVNECPGDFTPRQVYPGTTISKCAGFVGGNQSTTTVSTSIAAYCLLDSAKTYYFNLKFVDSNGSSTCGQTCAVYTDWIW